MKFTTLKEAVKFRITEDKDNYWINDYWEAALEIFSKNIDETIDFFKNDCTDEELFWISEIFEELIAKTQSRKLLDVLRTRLNDVTENKYNQNAFETEHMRKYVDYKTYVKDISDEINYAEGQLKESE